MPFDVIRVFSTNMQPRVLAEEAGLRRIGYKIEFGTLTVEQYEHIWRDACAACEVDYRPEVLNYVVNELHTKKRVALLPCHPRDLLGMALDHAVYEDNSREVGVDHIRWAWDNYFVPVAGRDDEAGRRTP